MGIAKNCLGFFFAGIFLITSTPAGATEQMDKKTFCQEQKKVKKIVKKQADRSIYYYWQFSKLLTGLLSGLVPEYFDLFKTIKNNQEAEKADSRRIPKSLLPLGNQQLFHFVLIAIGIDGLRKMLKESGGWKNLYKTLETVEQDEDQKNPAPEAARRK